MCKELCKYLLQEVFDYFEYFFPNQNSFETQRKKVTP